MEDEPKLWIVNKSGAELEQCIMELKQFKKFEPNRPVELPRSIALRLIGDFPRKMYICDNPEEYFQASGRIQSMLIIRDNGIGDLLLLEPIIRKFKEKEKINIDVLTMNPDIYKHNPIFNSILTSRSKDQTAVDKTKYDRLEDLRNYSEYHDKRSEMHRSLIYNFRFGEMKFNDEELEPKIFIGPEEKNRHFDKNPGMTYVGIECDASHSYRRYDRGRELVEYILSQNDKNIVVVFGKTEYVTDINRDRVINLQGKTTVREMILAIRDLDYLIAVDSGIMHIGLSYHVPTVCMFSIITPDFRVKYYTGQKKVIAKTNLKCFACGDKHMTECIHGNKKNNQAFIPPCMDISPAEIYDNLLSMSPEPMKRFFQNEQKKVNVNTLPQKKLVMPIIVLNEEKNLPRFVELVMSNPAIGKVIAIDGGSTDKTVDILKSAGAFVYVHPYDVDFHDIQAMQRNYSCAFVKDGEKIIIMDIDECFSKELSDYLLFLAESSIEYGVISRRTFDYFADINDPAKRIKDYPDWQPRFFTWNRKYKWVGSPHHNIYNCPAPIRIQKDIVHFEKEGKDREELERKWADMQRRTKEVYS